MEAPLLEHQKQQSLLNESVSETKKLWKIAGPAIFTAICQYSLGAITQTFAGHIGELELAAVAIENSVIAGFAFGVMLGMGSALETLCGQAFGAGQLRMLGVYMQRSWVILICTACILIPVYVFSPPILIGIGQQKDIANLAGTFAIWMIPQLFAYALNFPIQKFLQSQRKVMAMAVVSGIVLVIHIFLSWLFIVELKLGLIGAALTLNFAWLLIDALQLVYIFWGTCGEAWSGFSWQAFNDLWEFVKLSLASAVMLWYDFFIEIFVYTCSMNLQGWDAMIAIGFNAAISVRVSNELGAKNARGAKFSVIVVSLTSIIIGAVIMALVLVTRHEFPPLFTSSPAVAREVTRLSGLLAFTILLNSLQPVLSGVAIGAGWQALVAYINIGCYYIVGLPAGFLLGFKLNLGVEGIWGGMIGGIVLQTMILIGVTACTNWDKEASH
ncbi:Protein TRANSPARENT TESTA 12 [Acorus gramineus]|uniref:Protein TRANSPARENT TESTA 12 n=1 Tax=Acorus gramineus TaxID=55184 RepID=A0AAV9BKN7_ACOGR|nr:Protein TRANSPARENT TESTA 12 [Acorus gramineus]